MKAMRWIAAALFVLAGAVTEAQAPRADDRGTPDVVVRVELIEVAHAVLSELMADPRLVRDGSALRRRLQELAMAGRAEILETMMARGAGPRAFVAEAGREWIYPAEVEPPNNPHVVGIGSMIEPPVLKNPFYGQMPPHPTAFTTRTAGSTLTVQVEAAESGGTVDFNYAAEFVVKGGDTVHLHQRKQDGNEYGFRTPKFDALAPRNRLAVPDGRHVLADTGSRAGAPGKKVLVMVRADVAERGASIE